MTISVAIYLYPDVEVLDFAGPYEVFTTASRVFARTNQGKAAPFSVFSVARDTLPVRARAGLHVLPEHDLGQHPSVDLLIVPGGVVTHELCYSDILEWIADHHRNGAVVASVCTGAFLLGKAGLLIGKTATTHWEDIAELRQMLPDTHVVEACRWVDEVNTVTSAGISAGIDMSLHLVERLAGRELALATARQMDVKWQET